MKFTKPTRVWINAQSSFNVLHKFNGLVGIAHTDEKGITSIYFTEGEMKSMVISDKHLIYLATLNSQNDIFKTGA